MSDTSPNNDPEGSAPEEEIEIPGNMALGFLAGFFGGCIGYILVNAMAKGKKTKRGAQFGFITQIAVGGAIRVTMG